MAPGFFYYSESVGLKCYSNNKATVTLKLSFYFFYLF